MNQNAMLCPIDRTPLTMSDRQGIEIDFCPTCRGVWLDRGELDKIIERSATPPSTSGVGTARSSDRFYGDDDGYHGRGHGRRRKSFLSELFD